MSVAVKNKKNGAKFEGQVREALNNLGQFIYVKGVSSKGIDIFALKDDRVLFLELKSYLTLTTSEKKDSIHQFQVNNKIVIDFLNKTKYKPENVVYKLLIYERNIQLYKYNLDTTYDLYLKPPRTNIVKFIEQIIAALEC